jgi:hypothetical protein
MFPVDKSIGTPSETTGLCADGFESQNLSANHRETLASEAVTRVIASLHRRQQALESLAGKVTCFRLDE